MRLRNKKTGEIKEYTHTMTSYHVPIKGGYEIFTPWYPEEWEELEDVKEPLIKDEKIRKAVRAWAEVNGIDRAVLGQVNNDELVKKSPTTAFGCHISFEGSLGLERGRNYTIAELCGDEE